MAAKRITQSTFNWAALAERIPEVQRNEYLAFKTKSDNYLRRMMANPEKPPAFDWQYYANTVPVPGLVEEFKKKYDSFQIPVPAVDTHYAQLAELEKEAEKDIATFKAESAKRICEYEEQIKKLKATIPYTMMTYEELAIYAPQYAYKPGKFFPTDDDDDDVKKDKIEGGH